LSTGARERILAAAPSADLVEPEAIASVDGVLEARLVAAPATITVAGQTFRANVFGGTYLAPTLRVRRGDQVRLAFENRIAAADVFIEGPQPSNLHYHGMSIPPVKPADYIYLTVSPVGSSGPVRDHEGHSMPPSADVVSGSFNYSWQVPAGHAKGEYWYHPHVHGFVTPQVMSGLSGMILVEGLVAEHYPELGSLRERVMLLRDIKLPGAPDGAPLTKTVNGQLNPVIRLRPGEWQVWHVGNLGANAFFDVSVSGQKVWVLARDGNLLDAPEPATSAFLVPGARSTLVVGGLPAGRYTLRSLGVDTGPAGDPNPDVVLATLVVDGAPENRTAVAARLQQPAVNRKDLHPTIEEVRRLRIDRRRLIEFSETADGKTFFINGKAFDPARNDVTVRLGDVEEWTIRNRSKELHVFHIHQLDFLVTRFRGEEYDARGLRDVVDVPYEKDGRPGEVTLIVAFTNPIIVGRFPFHCHILEHEDAGMMGNLVVTPRRAPKSN
jgi:FtsP/CotA-like multicopper oxidase with cupredoxin domain